MVTFKESFMGKYARKVIINHYTNMLCKVDTCSYQYSYSNSIYILSKTENPYLFNFKLLQV
jgi:hypothetical protein